MKTYEIVYRSYPPYRSHFGKVRVSATCEESAKDAAFKKLKAVEPTWNRRFWKLEKIERIY